MPNYVNDLTMQEILACLQSLIAFYLPKFTFWQVCSFVRLFVCAQRDTGRIV